MDREKVIRALRNCSVQNDVGCQGCPYFEERKTYGHEWCTTSMAQDALVLLKEQEAVEPVKIPWLRSDGSVSEKYRCGSCDLSIFPSYKYCPFCGQAVKWE